MRKSYSLAEISAKLTESGLKITPQRVMIFHELACSDKHPTVEDIFKNLTDEIPGLSLATVYKTLDTFYQKNLVKKIKGEDDSVHYDADLDSHNHLICTTTKKICDYNDPELQLILDNYFSCKNIEGFKIKEVQLNIIGETI